ncbi:hypothetical protein WJX72_007445 [[Myrmecia] bisecta]|uniref:Uncharacterized protein n=1 Tax=[Myrmecia] bisecta TaxID=41462 RepID=A0AAW1Q983_9CHLO
MHRPGDGLRVQVTREQAEAKRQRLTQIGGYNQGSQSLLKDVDEFDQVYRPSQKENRAPTNFAAFNSVVIRKNTNRGPVFDAPTTFADITTNRAAVPWANENILRREQLPSLLQAKFTSDEDTVSHAPVAAPELLDTLLAASEQPAIDWSLKTCVRFSSRQPFHVCEQGQVAKTSTVCEAIHSHTRRHDFRDGDNLQERYQRALMSWQYPAETWPKEAVISLMGTASTAGVMLARRRAWQEAFRGLFYALRHKRCNAFYYVTAPGARKPFVAFFGASGMAGRRHMHAIVSRSTQGMRAMMAGKDHGMTFSMPLAPEAQPAANQQHLEELKKYGQAKPVEQSGVDGKPQSLLYFQSAEQVHGLFDFLFGEPTAIDRRGLPSTDECDVPLLLAPVPFHGASLHQYQPQMLPVLDVVPKNGGGAHRVELRDRALPPWVVDRLCVVLSEAQEGQMQVLFDSDPLTSMFNKQLAPPGQGQLPKTTGSAADRGALEAAEEERWRAPPGRMAGLVVRELQCEDSKYTTRLCKV